MISAILTGSLLTKATGHHDRFYYAGSPGAGSADVEARSGPKLALEPQQRASRGSSDFIRASGTSPHQEAGHMTEGRQPFTAEIKTLAKGQSTYDPLENES